MAEAGAGSDEVAVNRELWTQANSEYADEHAVRAWAVEDIMWGIFNVPEQQLRLAVLTARPKLRDPADANANSGLGKR